MNRFEILAVIFMCLFFFSLGVVIDTTHCADCVCPDITCPEQPEAEERIIFEKVNIKPEWLNIIENFGIGKEYINDSEAERRGISAYMCNDFSSELNRELRSMGIESYQVLGKCSHINPPNIRHAYIKVCRYYEPQTGEDISGLCQENR